MGILAWIVLGLIAGAIAKALMPGKDPGGIIVTMLIGIVGAFIGGFIGNTDHRLRPERLLALEHHPRGRRRDAAAVDLSSDHPQRAPPLCSALRDDATRSGPRSCDLRSGARRTFRQRSSRCLFGAVSG